MDHGLGVDLGDPRLGHPDDLADLGQGQALEVVEQQHRALAFGQARDRLAEDLAGVRPLELLGSRAIAFGADGVAERHGSPRCRG